MDSLILILTIMIFGEVTMLLFKRSPKVQPAHSEKRKIYVDTSSLMDSRLLSVAQTGFLGDDLLIPRSVTNELQLVADGKDADKRARARAGLDTVRELERVLYFNTTIVEDELNRTPVDNRLIDLAKANGGIIMTNDFNLQKVAETEGIEVLNLNELALAVRSEYLPGERAKVRVVTAGNNPHQGVAYMPNGMMVIIDNASDKINKEIEIEFMKLNQTASGAIMFARIFQPNDQKPTGHNKFFAKVKKNKPKRQA